MPTQTTIINPVIPVTSLRLPSLDDYCRDPLPSSLWMEPNIKRALDAGTSTYVYVAGTGGCAQLFDKMGAPVMKIGTTSDLPRRISRLSQDKYAAFYLSGGVWTPAEAHFDRWKLEPIRTDRIPSQGSPVGVAEGNCAFTIRLPAGLDGKAFEELLIHKLRAVSIRLWAQSSIGREQLTYRGIDPGVAVRATYCAPKQVFREVRELYFFHRHWEFNALMVLLEEIILAAILRSGEPLLS